MSEPTLIPLDKVFDELIKTLDNDGVLSTVMTTGSMESFTSEIYSDEEYHSFENMFELSIESLSTLNILIDPVLDSGKVDRLTMEALERRFPNAMNPAYPTASFTKDPSVQNIEASLESFSIAKALAVAAIGAVLGGIIMALIKLFRSDNLESRSEAINKKISEVKEQEKEFKKKLRAMDRNVIPPELSKKFDDLVNNVPTAYDMIEMRDGNNHTKLFLENLNYGGDVFNILRECQGSIQQQYTSYNARIEKLVGYLDVLYETKGIDNINKLIKDFHDLTLEPDDPFFLKMKELKKIMDGFKSQSGDDMNAFLNDNVYGTKEYYEYVISDDQWVKAADAITPKGSKTLSKNLDGLEKSANQLMKGRRDKAAKASRKKSKVVGNSIQMGSVNINPNLEMASRDAEMGIRYEAQHLQIYRINLNRVLEFYRRSLIQRSNMVAMKGKMMNDIINKPGT